MSDANLWNFMCNCVLKFYFQIGSCMCAKHPRLIRLFLLFKVLKFARGEQICCLCAVRAHARVKAFGIDFLPMAFNQSTTCERRNIRQTANVIKFTNRVHMFWLIEECTTIMYICIALHSEHSKLYLRHQRWSSFRFFYAIINLFRITISAPKTQFKRFLYVFLPYECMSCQYV